MFEFIDSELSSHYYTERYERDNRIYTEQVRLLSHRNGSLLRFNQTQGKIVFVSPSSS